MSNERANITGSAAREHEATGGNVKAGQSNLPPAGSAAQAAEAEAKAQQEAYGGQPASQYRGTAGMRLPQVRGARMVEAEKPKPDLSQRTAADYLPPHLKAQLIAEGKLTAAGELVKHPTPPAPQPLPPAPAADGVQTPTPVGTAEPATWLGSLARQLRNLFR